MPKKIKVKLTKAVSSYYMPDGTRYQPGDVFEVEPRLFNPLVMVRADEATAKVPEAPEKKEFPKTEESEEVAVMTFTKEEKAEGEEKAKTSKKESRP